MRGSREDDCEYTDNQGRTRTQMLEENVARLQARLHELENPTAPGSSILLHDPYDASRRSNTGVVVPPFAPGAEFCLGLGATPTSTQGLSASGMLSAPIRPGSAPAVMPWWEFEEPPVEVASWL